MLAHEIFVRHEPGGIAMSERTNPIANINVVSVLFDTGHE
jgi:hypothetical protein